jgi:hypothetical protein
MWPLTYNSGEGRARVSSHPLPGILRAPYAMSQHEAETTFAFDNADTCGSLEELHCTIQVRTVIKGRRQPPGTRNDPAVSADVRSPPTL